MIIINHEANLIKVFCNICASISLMTMIHVNSFVLENGENFYSAKVTGTLKRVGVLTVTYDLIVYSRIVHVSLCGQMIKN